LLGIGSEELEKILGAGVSGNEGLTDPDAIPEPPDEAITRRGDVWILGDHRLMCGDSSSLEDLDRLMDGQSAALAFTDPPYNVKVEPRSNNAIAAGLQLVLNCRFKRFGHNRGKPIWRGLPTKDPKVNLVRYADDFIITATSKELLNNEVLPMVREFLAERGLTLSEEKTRITHIEEGFDFLGKTVRKFDGKFREYPAKKSVKAFLQKVREIIRTNRSARPVTLIRKLNPVIRGWANYHRPYASRSDFSKVSGAIFKAIWHWAKRRHPKKGMRWIRQKYFTKCGNSHWVFFGELREGGILRLYQIGRETVGFYAKVNNEVNPYDPAWREYLAKREKRGTSRLPRYAARPIGQVDTHVDE
jgi:hypothetical protein